MRVKAVVAVIGFPVVAFCVGVFRGLAIEDSTTGEALATGVGAALVVLIALGLGFLLIGREDRTP